MSSSTQHLAMGSTQTSDSGRPLPVMAIIKQWKIMMAQKFKTLVDMTQDRTWRKTGECSTWAGCTFPWSNAELDEVVDFCLILLLPNQNRNEICHKNDISMLVIWQRTQRKITWHRQHSNKLLTHRVPERGTPQSILYKREERFVHLHKHKPKKWETQTQIQTWEWETQVCDVNKEEEKKRDQIKKRDIDRQNMRN